MTAKFLEDQCVVGRRPFPTSSVTGSSGFSLIELMIAMILGLLIIGAVGTVFISAQQSYRVKADFEEAQEAFRFASHVINRLVQTSESIIEPDSSGTELRIQLVGGPGIFDCTGVEIPANLPPRTNAFFRGADGTLRCDPNAVSGEPVGTGVALVSRVDAVSFRYADLQDNLAPLVSAGAFKEPTFDPVDGSSNITWNNARSVRTTIRMDTGLQTFFTSTSRGASIGEPITVN
jgi:prepilin-type N-terminal cleavage/methylation domain-containing protein